MLKVNGDSMNGRGILDGDYVLITPSATPKDGDIIAARLGEEATVKSLTHQGQTIVLEPANPADRAIEIGPHDDFKILGVVCGVFRPFWEQQPQPTIQQADDLPVS